MTLITPDTNFRLDLAILQKNLNFGLRKSVEIVVKFLNFLKVVPKLLKLGILGVIRVTDYDNQIDSFNKFDHVLKTDENVEYHYF